MNTFNSLLNVSLLIILLSACGKPAPRLDHFDQDAWQADRDACGNQRMAMLPVIEEQKEKLLGLDEMTLVQVLGKPDQNELYKRNQKFYFYYLEPAPECAGGKTTAKRLSVRFNATGLAKEINVE